MNIAKRLEEIEKTQRELSATIAELRGLADKAEPLHNGYTMSQWRQMCEGPRKGIPFVCEMWDPGDDNKYIEVLDEVGSPCWFRSDHKGYDNCRLITTPGHWIPWFGGECPVDGEVVVMLGNGRLQHRDNANTLSWVCVGQYSVIAYMTPPKVTP